MSEQNKIIIDLNGHSTNSEIKVNQVPEFSGVSLTKSPVWIVKEKVTFLNLLARDKHKLKKSGKSLMCRCPFHHDNTPSFSIYNDGRNAKCFGCGWHGDIFDYEQQAHKVGFREALERLEKVAQTPTKYPIEWQAPIQEPSPFYFPTPEEIGLQMKASKRLAEDHVLCEAIAEARGWLGETIETLAAEGSLGWHENALVFNYLTGMKLRAWPDRKIWWEFGNPSLWRGDQMVEGRPVILCEGETDAISLLDAGLEMNGEYSLVALASATSIPIGLPEILAGKDVVLCMDDDEAGKRAAAKLIPLLLPSCSSVSTFVFEEVVA